MITTTPYIATITDPQKRMSMKKLIESASDHPAASHGQFLAHKLLLSLSNYKTTVNLRDALCYFDAAMISDCVEVASHGGLGQYWTRS